MLRSVHRETEERHDHLDIFREFLDHLARRSVPQEVMTANRLTGASFNADPFIVMAGPKQRLCA